MADIFLLGGCDLEMCVIKKLLVKHNKKFYDKNLKWGAKLSSYKEEIKNHQNDTIYAIELENDLNLKNIVLIDHHNENSSNPSSLEQIAKILNHKLNKFEKIVSVNDSRYIDGMIEEGFKLKDIKKIRQLDRKCQGVNEVEEKVAKEVKLKRIIYFPYEHFSPLNDRIFFEKGWKKYIILNDNLTMFYGFNIETLKNILKQERIEEFFYGGGERGFLGVEKKLDKKLLERIFELKDTISHHIFMFPFVIDKKEEFNKKLKNEWEGKDFEFSRVEYYNEFVYFYPHVRDVLFGKDKAIASYYEKNLGEDSKYIIRLKNGKIYELEIEDISLRVFNDSIGVLSFHLNNSEYQEPTDILKINDFGRRLFPQFLDREKLVNGTKNAFLPDSIEIKIDNETFAKEDFSKFEDKEYLKNLNLKNIEKELLPEFITKLVGNEIKIILDDRMFTVSFYLDSEKRVIDKLRNFKNSEYGYMNEDLWYKYVFVDGGYKTCQSKLICKGLIVNSTYDRWIDVGTLWGVSRYSFVGISDWDLMMVHTKTIYYQMMVLLLLYRAIMVYFSNEVKKIVDNIKANNKSELQQNSKKLYKKYLKFLNGLYFKEITPQEQGIELYKKALKIMEIEEYIKDFDREVSELDSYIEMEIEKERNKELDKLNKIATIFLPPTLLASLLGMNVGVFDDNKQCKFLIAIILFILSIRVGELQFLGDKKERILEKIFSKLNMSEEKEKIVLLLVLIIGIILLGLI